MKHKKYPKRLLLDRSDNDWFSKDFWTTLDGQTIPLVNLRPKHLEKIIHHVKHTNRESLLPPLENELLRRRMLKLAKRSKTGKVLYGR